MHSLVTFLIVLAAIAVPLIVVGIGSHIAAIHAPKMPGWRRVKAIGFGTAWFAIFAVPHAVVVAYASVAHMAAVALAPIMGLVHGARILTTELVVEAWTHICVVKALIMNDIDRLVTLRDSAEAKLKSVKARAQAELDELEDAIERKVARR